MSALAARKAQESILGLDQWELQESSKNARNVPSRCSGAIWVISECATLPS